jgi:hypothetical protein
MALIYNKDGDAIIQIANEFTTVHVGYARTGNGERLVIASPALGCETQLDPLQLECLTWQRPQMYSELLATPHGPVASIANFGAFSELIDKGSSWDF